MNKWKDLFIVIVVIYGVLSVLGVFGGHISVVEMVPVDKSIPVKVVVYVTSGVQLKDLRGLGDLNQMDFTVSYKVPKLGDYIGYRVKNDPIAGMRINIKDGGHIRLER